jgi:hypothetical protein
MDLYRLPPQSIDHLAMTGGCVILRHGALPAAVRNEPRHERPSCRRETGTGNFPEADNGALLMGSAAV